jgi:7,8-dihydropterin-6-yl-methyl-4-(beta-D-ribofuranosyl)aminobenzene 5'-phosphate synthase
MALLPVDSCAVLVLVDNVSDLLSTVPQGVTGEVANVVKAGATELAGRCLCCAQWGLSLLITVQRGGTSRTVLFDSGPEGYGILRNAERLGVDWGGVDEAVFSHGHWDHVGGMTAALERMRDANGGRRVPVHTNVGMFVRRAMRLPAGELPMERVPSPAELEAAGAEVVLGEGPRLLADGMMLLSGEIPRLTPYEKGLPGQVAEQTDGSWAPDPLIRDERWLAVHVAGLGAIVFSACSHAGIVNVLSHARDTIDVPLHGVMGGFHLSGAAWEAIIPETVRDMTGFGLKAIVPGHCTGWRAVQKLVDAFGDGVVVPSAVGRRHLFAA